MENWEDYQRDDANTLLGILRRKGMPHLGKQKQNIFEGVWIDGFSAGPYTIARSGDAFVVTHPTLFPAGGKITIDQSSITIPMGQDTFSGTLSNRTINWDDATSWYSWEGTKAVFTQ